MDNQHFDPSIEALLSLGRAIDEARGEVVTAIALALNDYGRSVEISALCDEESGERQSHWSDKSLTMRRRPW